MTEEEKRDIYELREIVRMEDIPSPTVPEYIEHHASIVKILDYIDKVLLKRPDKFKDLRSK